MNKISKPNSSQKLLVIYRLEAECLGTHGHKEINEFCHHLTERILPPFGVFVDWLVLPRLVTRETDFEFRINGKLLNENQLTRYLAAFELETESFKEIVSEAIVRHIEKYF